MFRLLLGLSCMRQCGSVLSMCYLKLKVLKVLMLVTASFLASCASIFNSKNTAIDIYTSKPIELLINGDTLKRSSVFKGIILQRSKDPLKITTFLDSPTTSFIVKPINSLAYKSNIGYAIFGWAVAVPYLVDMKKAKRFTYPSPLYLDIAKGIYDEKLSSELNNDKKNVIKFTPLKLTDLVNPSVEVAYERRTSASFSSQFMFSTLLSKSLYGNVESIKGFGYRLAFEKRYYPMNFSPKGLYYAVELDYLKKDYLTEILFSTDKVDEDSCYGYETYWDSVLVNKRLVNLSFKIGYQATVGDFIFDGYLGLGFRYRYVEHQERMNPNDKMQGPRHPNVHHYKNLPGKGLKLNIPFNLRIGYSF